MHSPSTYMYWLALLLALPSFVLMLIAATHHKEGQEGQALSSWSMFSSKPFTTRGNYYRKRALPLGAASMVLTVAAFTLQQMGL